MSRRRKRLLAIGLGVAIVVASGQYMERSQAASSLRSAGPTGTAPSVAAPGDVAQRAAGIPPSPVVRARALPAPPSEPAGPKGLMPMRLPAGFAARPDDALADIRAGNQRYGVSGLPCGPTLTATVSGEASVRLIVSASCRPDMPLRVHHDVLSFTGRTDRMGLFTVELPAMAAAAAFVAELDDGTTATRALAVPGADHRTHAALVAAAGSGLSLHAYEDGAGFGEAGHVWAGAPRGKAARGRHFVLGDVTVPGARVAEIYSAPAERGLPRLSVETEVTEANCGREVVAHTVLPGPDGRPDVGRFSVAVPECAAVGEFLVLKNLPQLRKLASN